MLAIDVFGAAGHAADAILGVLAVVGDEVGRQLGRKGHCDVLFGEFCECV